MNIISTWIYIDAKGEESEYPQVGSDSSATEFQNVYWRCVALFFIRARKFNPSTKLVLFTNLEETLLPTVDDCRLQTIFTENDVEIHTVPAQCLPPKDYYQGWRNQFYVFDIIRYLSDGVFDDKDKLVVLDSDCLWISSADPIWEILEEYRWPNYIYDYSEDHLINGISRRELGRLYATFSGRKISDIPNYSGGEILSVQTEILPKILKSFDTLWQQLLKAHANGESKFNEEAHALSYIHFLLNEEGEGKLNTVIKRMWTDGNSYRNIKPGDEKLPLWHLPAEKRLGFQKLFELTMTPRSRFHSLSLEEEKILLAKIMGVVERKPSLVRKIASKMKRLVS